ncbi:MAG: glycosyltransferase family 4 protein, partial [Bacilli bacterium]|nr:glycosyltransferase family 4 protein [Bacilli bacterium]
LLEAMYLKKVCIVSNCIGNRDVIKNGENGFIISNENYDEIIKNLNIEVCNKVSSKAKEDVINEFNIEKMIESYKKLYHKIKI